MTHSYEIYLAAACSRATGQGAWVADTYPSSFRWTVGFQGKAKCQGKVALLAKAAIRALADLETRCDVILHVSDGDFLDYVNAPFGASYGLSRATEEELAYQMERHDVTISHVSDRRMQAALKRLEEELE